MLVQIVDHTIVQVDQVTALEELGISVATINSNTPFYERRLIIEDLLSGHPRTRLLYVTPELCEMDHFRRNLMTIHSQGELRRIAIDEAHCISEWGHDFRPAYKELSWFRRMLRDPPVPITALTATATPRVRADAISSLGLDTATLKIFTTPSARPNIHYEVRYLTDYAPDPIEPEYFQVHDLVMWLKSIQTRRETRLKTTTLPPMSGIVYVAYRSTCEKLAELLSKSPFVNIEATPYHAGLPGPERERIQIIWRASMPPEAGTDKPTPAFRLVVATNAFGMGIDNHHVRFVVHWTPPRSFEGLVQESGRAGRDGCAAAHLVYYNTQERDRILEYLRRDTERIQTQTRGGIKRSHSTSTLETDNNATINKNIAKSQNQKARIESFRKVIRYCETTNLCRHGMIKEFGTDLELEAKASATTKNMQTATDANINNTNAAAPSSELDEIPPLSSQRLLPHTHITPYEEPMIKQEEQPKIKKEEEEDTKNPPDLPLHLQPLHLQLQPPPQPLPLQPQTSSPCDYACDFCKEGPELVSYRKSMMVPPSPPEDMMSMEFVPFYMSALFPELFRNSRNSGSGMGASYVPILF